MHPPARQSGAPGGQDTLTYPHEGSPSLPCHHLHRVTASVPAAVIAVGTASTTATSSDHHRRNASPLPGPAPHTAAVVGSAVESSGGIAVQVGRIPQPHRILQRLGTPDALGEPLGTALPGTEAFGGPHHGAIRRAQPQQRLPAVLGQVTVGAVQLTQQDGASWLWAA